MTSISYFVICVDCGRAGREAVVDPEMTFNGAVEKVRELIGDGKEIARSEGRTLSYTVAAPGVYRLEASLPLAGELRPWIYTGAILVTP